MCQESWVKNQEGGSYPSVPREAVGKMAHVFGPLPSMKETKTESLAHDFGLGQPRLLKAFGQWNSLWKISFSTFISLSYTFLISIFKKEEAKYGIQWNSWESNSTEIHKGNGVVAAERGENETKKQGEKLKEGVY